MKGGVGKTTLAANVTRSMVELLKKNTTQSPQKILLIDCDAQCNLSQIFMTTGDMDRKFDRTFYQAFDASFKQYGPSDIKIQIFPNNESAQKPGGDSIDLIPGSFRTFKFIFSTANQNAAAAQTFRIFMEKAREEYDMIVLDTNPSATFTTLQALEFTDYLISPITFDSFSLRGIDLVLQTMKKRYPKLQNPNRIVVVPNKVQRSNSEQEFLRQNEDEEKIIRNFPGLKQSLSASRIHFSKFLDNNLSRRGLGFVHDQNVRAMHRRHLAPVIRDFDSVARTIFATIKRVEHHASGLEENSIRDVQDEIQKSVTQFEERPHIH
jgi:chromosome partitioning protein